MTPERWEQIGNLYEEARKLSPETRAEFLDQTCAEDESLRREVESLLAAEAVVGDFIVNPALKDAAGLLTSEVPGGMVGKQLGHYQVLSFIGAGGMGEIYAAKDPRLGRKVAIKLLPAAVLRDADRLQRFEQEARAVGMLNHPNILTIHDTGVHEGAPYIVSELLEGETLRDRMKDGPLTSSRVADIALQITRGLAAAHERGIVHRDLKPENIFITTDERIKILDFGLAKLTQPDFIETDANGQAFPVVRTSPGLLMGTVGYMAPEQLRGEEADHRVDIFAFGVILFELLTGERPFRGDSAVETMSAILKQEAPELPSHVSTQSPELGRVIHRCLEKKEQQRFQSASDLGFAIEGLNSSTLNTSGMRLPGGGAVDEAATLTFRDDRNLAARRRIGPLGWAGWALAGVFMLVTIGLTIAYFRRPAIYSRIVPFTSFPGQKSRPVFSPDGNQIAFFWDGESGDDTGIFVKLIDSGTPLRLNSLNGGRESDLAWSPDGRSIAFVRTGREGGIFTVPALGGPERKLTDMAGSFAWSPDGKKLAIVRRDSPQDPFSIFLLSLETGETRRLTKPQTGSFGDLSPAWSPDGQTIAYIHSPYFQVSDIHTISVTEGEPRRITFDNLDLRGGLDWTANGHEIIYSSPRGGLHSLWRVSATGGRPRRLIGIGEDAYEPSIARQGSRLAYVYRRIDRNIWLAPGLNSTDPNAANKAPVKLIASTRDDVSPHFSPDGKRIVFISDRSGSKEIWVCSIDGLNAVQLTSFGGSHTGTPRWSPDGRQIAFDSRPEGQTDIFAVSAEGGRPRRVTTENSEDVMPSWSSDGRWIYFGSRRSGDWQIWKSPSAGGQAVQVTMNGGYEAFESPDGKYVYYMRLDSEGIWRVRSEGGEEIKVYDRGRRGYWALLEGGLCLLNPIATPAPTIEYFNFATRQLSLLGRVGGVRAPFGAPALAVSADGKWVLYFQVDQIDNDIMLVENFR